MNLEDLTLNVEQHLDVPAAIEDAFKAVLYRFGQGNVNPNGESMQMVLEEWPGGRWFRDRGNGVGHLWGHVQVIKPPQLLELCGPLFMSYPAINHVEVKLTEIPTGTRLTLRHRALGLLDPAHRQHIGMGWKHYLDNIQKDAGGTLQRA